MLNISFNVDTEDWKTKFPMYKKYINKTVFETLNMVDYDNNKNLEISFFLTSDKNIKVLNNKFRNKNKATNVLSFPMMHKIDGYNLLGDIVISCDKIIDESMIKKIKKYEYLSYIVIHGLLHLLGYDHKTNQQYKEMNLLEIKILKKLYN